ncbi:MAG: hypothetical protein KDC67_13255 [Ignavibacteriae bacterium]|nr:hypothetical protein [Ignavibacteriota bacterium]
MKDMILLDSELQNSNIRFYNEIVEQPQNSDTFRYYFLNSDNERVNNILVKNEIIAFSESNIIGDFKDNRKTLKLVLLITVILIATLVLVGVFLNLFG